MMKLYDVIRKEQHDEPVSPEKETFVFSELPTDHPHRRRKRIIFVAIILSAIVFLYVVGNTLSRATITVEERSIPFSIEKATIELPHETSSDTERLSFQTMVVTTEIHRDLFGSEVKEVTGKARGSVVFFNEYSKNSVALKTGTKILSPSGKQYQTTQAVTIPGYTLVNKKKTAGTSISVAVVAIESGPASNSAGTSFSIVGYSGTKKTQLYARSVGSLTGGESGMRHSVSTDQREEVLETLKTQLVERLKRETRAQIPEHLITFPDLQFVSIDTESLKLEGEGVKFPAQIKGSMVSYLIPRKLFEAAIAKEALSDHSFTDVSVPALSSLSVVPVSGVPASPAIVPDSISIAITGEGSIITKVSPEKVIDAVVGTPKGSFGAAVASIPEIASARYSFTPFWAPFFPKDPSRIRVILK